MFFFIAGIQSRTVRLEKHGGACPNCSHFEVYLKRVEKYISVFFIPLIRIKKGVPFASCENCNSIFESPARMEMTEIEEVRRCGSCGKAAAPEFNYCPYCGKWI